MNKKITFSKVENYPGLDNRFRFRVYDKEEKKYVSFCFHATLHNSFLEVGDRQIIEQCTGICDKNHKFIFEGDILKDTRFGKLYKVTWVGCSASFEMTLVDGEEKINPKPLYFANRSFGWFKIIGNVHEMEVEK